MASAWHSCKETNHQAITTASEVDGEAKLCVLWRVLFLLTSHHYALDSSLSVQIMHVLPWKTNMEPENHWSILKFHRHVLSLLFVAHRHGTGAPDGRFAPRHGERAERGGGTDAE